MKLNLGCGRDIRAGYVNMDRNDYPGVDLIWDLDRTPWPMSPKSFEFVYASHVLEHVQNFPAVWKEVERVLVPGGMVMVRVPYGFNANPFHTRFFDEHSIDLLTQKQYRMTDHPASPFEEVSREFHRRPDGFPALHLSHYLGLPVRGHVWELEFILRKPDVVGR